MKYQASEFSLSKPDGSLKNINADVNYFSKGNVLIKCNTPLSSEERCLFIDDILKGGELDVKDLEYFEQLSGVDGGNQFARISFNQDSSGAVMEEEAPGDTLEVVASREYIDLRIATLEAEEPGFSF